MRNSKIKKLVCRDRGDDEYLRYISSSKPSPENLAEASKTSLRLVPHSFGACVAISTTLVATLEDDFSIPAIAVLGDLKVDGSYVFKCDSNIPKPSRDRNRINEQWDGHCWVEAGGIICDLSIFRTAYAIERPSLLKSFVLSNFGPGKGALLAPPEHIPSGLEFSPKYVLNDAQIEGVLAGLQS